MILVLEGATGTGKSALATRLAAEWMVPLYRPFRFSIGDHVPGSTQDLQGAVPLLPINTWREDMYVSDAIRGLSVGQAVLDRSLPSGLVYNTMGPNRPHRPQVLSRDQCDILLRIWADNLSAVGAALVLVECSEEERQRRGARTGVWEVEGLMRMCSLIHHLTRMPVYRLNSEAPTEECAQAVRHAIWGKNHRLISTHNW